MRCQSQLERITDIAAAGEGVHQRGSLLATRRPGIARQTGGLFGYQNPFLPQTKALVEAVFTDAWRESQKSWGSLLAEHIWQEVLLAFEYRHNSVEASM